MVMSMSVSMCMSLNMVSEYECASEAFLISCAVDKNALKLKLKRANRSETNNKKIYGRRKKEVKRMGERVSEE